MFSYSQVSLSSAPLFMSAAAKERQDDSAVLFNSTLCSLSSGQREKCQNREESSGRTSEQDGKSTLSESCEAPAVSELLAALQEEICLRLGSTAPSSLPCSAAPDPLLKLPLSGALGDFLLRLQLLTDTELEQLEAQEYAKLLLLLKVLPPDRTALGQPAGISPLPLNAPALPELTPFYVIPLYSLVWERFLSLRELRRKRRSFKEQRQQQEKRREKEKKQLLAQFNECFL